MSITSVSLTVMMMMNRAVMMLVMLMMRMTMMTNNHVNKFVANQPMGNPLNDTQYDTLYAL